MDCVCWDGSIAVYCICWEVDEWMKDVIVGQCCCRHDSFAVKFPLRCIAKLHSTGSVFSYLIQYTFPVRLSFVLCSLFPYPCSLFCSLSSL